VKTELEQTASRRRVCRLCQDGIDRVDYKDALVLKRFLTLEGKIISRALTGNCAEHQRQITLAVKRCRQIGLFENA
jgi:small subunit ribosomal protein S18